ncbi:uncharacterized protein BJ212DRAFT_1259709 [Suillus subaureus]|uniref:Uncharacterized protein n=1 Tax=Suillus subaureus TaxID=48587 RepID=A0A9P7EMX7_9AGAM|nr:uncharacterized protein BJ212DRAFT_1259709 [Suillus subaureus]KAG1825634.1 hypothetical protein BJ212DRAFT_1259709 [Suillus subaureus]
MTRPFTTYGDHSTDYLSAQHPDPSPSDDFKSYNDDLSDLIDQYAEPYSRTSRHQTFAVSTDLLDDSDSRDRSFSTDQKGSYTVDKVAEEDPELDPSNHDYPPTLKQEKPIDTRSCWAKVLPDSWACRLFVLTVVIETAVDLAIEGDLLVRLQDDSGKLAVYLSVFALAHIFQLVMAVDAVYARNTLQFLSLIIFNLLFLLYAVIEISEIKNSSTNSAGILHVPVNVLADIIPAVISTAEIAYIGLGWKIYNEFGWKVYKFLGADRRIKKMYATYQIFECLVKFDIFFWVGFSVQFIWLVLQKNDWEYYVTWAALPLSILLLIEGHLAARHENKWMMGTFMFGSTSALVYFTYKLFRVLQYRDTQYALYWKSLSTFSAIAIVLLVITMIFSVLVMRNFGRGLKASIARSKTHTQGRGSQHLNRGPMSTNPNRMSIE